MEANTTSRYFIELTAGDASARLRACRVFIDLSSDGALEAEFEVPVSPTQGAWCGTFALPTEESFYYRVGIVGIPGASWRLSLRDEQGRLLLHDGDRLHEAKTWLLGSCASAPRRRARQPSLRAALALRGLSHRAPSP